MQQHHPHPHRDTSHPSPTPRCSSGHTIRDLVTRRFAFTGETPVQGHASRGCEHDPSFDAHSSIMQLYAGKPLWESLKSSKVCILRFIDGARNNNSSRGGHNSRSSMAVVLMRARAS